jgi:hypothetical protein
MIKLFENSLFFQKKIQKSKFRRLVTEINKINYQQKQNR